MLLISFQPSDGLGRVKGINRKSHFHFQLELNKFRFDFHIRYNEGTTIKKRDLANVEIAISTQEIASLSTAAPVEAAKRKNTICCTKLT